MGPVLPDPAVQASLNKFLTQTLARTYVNGQGKRVMLSIAYGADQGSDATQAHRPEFCYTGQGFSVGRVGQVILRFGGHELQAERLLGRMGARFEPITYWVTLNDKAVLPGVTRKLAQIRIGLGGLIPDGMLVRASTVGLEQAASFELQEAFLSQLYAALPGPVRRGPSAVDRSPAPTSASCASYRRQALWPRRPTAVALRQAVHRRPVCASMERVK